MASTSIVRSLYLSDAEADRRARLHPQLRQVTADLIELFGTFDARKFGATFDGVTDDTDALQDAIDECSAAGGGYIDCPDGTALVSTLTAKNNAVLRGVGDGSTTFKLRSGVNAPILRSQGYTSLVGQNKYLITDGVPYNFGLVDVRLDGNKANQSSGNGIEFYGKRIIMDHVLIKDVKGIGWVSEGWYNVGTALDPEHPESHYKEVHVQNCGSHGIQYRGPTDAIWHSVFSYLNTGWGARFEGDGSTYNAASDLEFGHIYANTAGGVFVGAQTAMRFGHLATESNFGQGLLDQSFGTYYDFIESYTNCRTTGSHSVEISGSNVVVNRLKHEDNAINTGGVLITGTGHSIGNGTVRAVAGTSTGVKASGTKHRLKLYVNGYSGAGGKGFESGVSATALSQSIVEIVAANNKTNLNIAVTGANNIWTAMLRAEAGQTNQAGSFDASEDTRVIAA